MELMMNGVAIGECNFRIDIGDNPTIGDSGTIDV
jgi:hypothetical protein